MKILIPPSEGKSKIKSTGPLFSDTNFIFDKHVSGKWNEAYKMIGFDPTSLSHFSGNA